MKNLTSGSVTRFRVRNMSNRLYSSAPRWGEGGGVGDFVFAKFEDDVDVIFIFETFLVADNVGMLEGLMDFDFSN
jgi:hypothetical protein